MLEDLTRPQPVATYCKVAHTAGTLEVSDRDILLKAVDDETWAAKALARQLRERGVQISDTTILRHRRRECSCE